VGSSRTDVNTARTHLNTAGEPCQECGEIRDGVLEGIGKAGAETVCGKGVQGRAGGVGGRERERAREREGVARGIENFWQIAGSNNLFQVCTRVLCVFVCVCVCVCELLVYG
jgi:hypothetical protein